MWERFGPLQSQNAWGFVSTFCGQRILLNQELMGDKKQLQWSMKCAKKSKPDLKNITWMDLLFMIFKTLIFRCFLWDVDHLLNSKNGHPEVWRPETADKRGTAQEKRLIETLNVDPCDPGRDLTRDPFSVASVPPPGRDDIPPKIMSSEWELTETSMSWYNWCTIRGRWRIGVAVGAPIPNKLM